MQNRALLGLALCATARLYAQSCSDPSFPANLPPALLQGTFTPIAILQDSTNYTGNERSDQRPQATSVDVESNWLAVSLYHGLYIYDLTNPHAPQRVYANSGYNGDWPVWIPGQSETDQWVYSAEWAPSDSTFLATGGDSPAGFAIWDTTSKTAPIPRYQDAGALSIRQMFTARINNRFYAFAGSSGAGATGVQVYDLSRSRELNLNRCVDRNGSETRLCSGVFVTSFATDRSSTYLAGLTAGTKTLLARASGTAQGLQLWDVSVPASPQLRVSGYGSSIVSGVALWTYNSNQYLAAIVAERSGPSSGWLDRLYIHNVSTCFSSTCAALPAAITNLSLPAHTDSDFWKPLVALTSNTKPILFEGFHDLCHEDAQIDQPHLEHYWDVSTPTAPLDITPQTQIDDAERLVDYWTWYYRDYVRGESWTSPLDAAFYGSYLVRADRSLLDLHLWNPVPAVPAANFTWSPSTIYPGDAVTFTDASTGLVASRSWTFTGGTPPSSTVSTPSASWATTGAKSVTLTATNVAGSNSKTQFVTISSALPAGLGITVTPSAPLVGDAVTFTANATGKPPLSYSWSISAGGPTLTGNPATWSTTGQAAGNRTVTLTVSNAAGSASTSTSFSLRQGLIRSWTPNCPNGVCIFNPPTLIYFTLDVVSGITQYAYDWDGNGSWDNTQSTPIGAHIFQTLGTFTPRLKVTTAAAATDTLSLSTPISILPITASITISGPTLLAAGTPAIFTAAATGCTPATTGWLWSTNGASGTVTTTSSQTLSWSTTGTKLLQASNSACGAAAGALPVTVTASNQLFQDSFESGTSTTWNGGAH